VRAARPRLWPAIAAACGVLLVVDAAPSKGQSGGISAAHGWAEGDVAATLAALSAGPPTREAVLDAAVVRLYAGQAAEAVAELAGLRARYGGWTPALRWLAHAQAQLGQPEALDSACALLGRPDADALDRIWAGDLLLRLDRPQQARSAFDAVVRWNGGVEVDLQRVEGARAPAAAAPHLAADPALGQLLLPSRLRSGERLRYDARYLFFHLADVTLETGGLADYEGRPARRMVFTAKSGDGVPFFHIDSRFESVVSTDGAVLAHRHVANDSDSGADEAGYDMDRRAGRCTVRTARDGVFGFHVLPLPENAQDGVSLLMAARALARVRGSAVVPTAVDGLWWPTELRTIGSETIRWRGRAVPTVRMQSRGRYRGAGGMSGAVDIWMSDDDRALPYRVKMKVAVGSVVLELLPEAALVANGAAADEVTR
jgi:uncharacterized protein DUF3108